MRKKHRSTESDEPLSEGRVEYLEAARQRVRNRRIRRPAVLLVLLNVISMVEASEREVNKKEEEATR